MTRGAQFDLVRPRRGAERVTNIELFFDLVYVFAVTQLSRHLLGRPTVTGALQTALLLAMVWLLWAYTAWVTNWLDPERMPVRLLLIALLLVALVMWAAIPESFGTRGLIIGIGYALSQIGRSIFAVVALRGRPLLRNFQRILAWCVVSGALAVAGGLASEPARAWFWLAAVGVDLLGGVFGFYTPGLGRSETTEWTIEGKHFAERCQAFILIALGESVLVIGATLSDVLGSHVSEAEAGAFLVAVVSSVGLWWLYFDRSADEAARVIAASADPGRMGRTAYRRVEGGAVVAAGRRGRARAAGPGGALRVPARAGSVRDRRGDRRRGTRLPPGRPPGSARAGIRDIDPSRLAVAVEDAPAVGAGGCGSAIGVQAQGPAPAVNDDEVVKGAQSDQVMKGGGPARRTGDEVVDVAHAGGLFAAGEGAVGVAGGDGTAQVRRDCRLSLGGI